MHWSKTQAVRTNFSCLVGKDYCYADLSEILQEALRRLVLDGQKHPKLDDNPESDPVEVTVSNAVDAKVSGSLSLIVPVEELVSTGYERFAKEEDGEYVIEDG